MSWQRLVAKADMTFSRDHHRISHLSQTNSVLLGAKVRTFGVVVALALLVSSCATEPVIPPTDLTSINVESTMDRLWSRKLEKSEKGRFKPLVISDVVYAASRSGEVVALDRETGTVRWRRNLNVSLSSGVGGSETSLFVSTNDGVILALSAADGALLWETQASSEVLVPVSAGFGTVLVRSADGRLLSLNPTTGEERWTVTYTPPALTLNGYSQPLLLDGGVLVGLDDGRLIAFGSNDGKVLWESVVSLPSGRSEVERLADIDGSIRVDDSAIYAVSYQGKLARIEPSKGEIIWSVPMSSTAGLAVSQTAAIVVGEDDELHAFDKSNGQLLWTQDALKHRRLTSPQIIADNLVVVGDLEGYLHTIDVADGRLIGRTRVAKKSIFPEIPLQENTLLVQAADGTVAALRAQP